MKDRLAHPLAAAYWPQCLAVEGMSRRELLDLRAKRWEALWRHVATHVPFYRVWAAASRVATLEPPRLEQLPILTKQVYRDDPEGFQSEAYLLRDMRRSRTSGSSGEPFAFRGHPTNEDFSYCCLWRALRRHGLRPGDRRAYVWGRSWTFTARGLRKRAIECRLRFRDWFNSTLSIDAYSLTDRNVEEAVARMERFRPVYVHGYVSAIYLLARHIHDRGRAWSGPSPKVVVTESEALYDFQRSVIGEAFRCPVFENYGSVELGKIAQSDAEGRLRINEDMFIVETLPGGEAVITNLMATAYPFIRYRIGDMIEIEPEIPPGLPYASIRRIMGRTVDLIPIPGGGYISGVALAHLIDPHLAHVRKYQVHQTAVDRFVVRLIPRGAIPGEVAQRIRADVRGLAGASVTVEVVEVDHLEPLPTGKFRWVRSDVSDVALRAMAEEQARMARLDLPDAAASH